MIHLNLHCDVEMDFTDHIVVDTETQQTIVCLSCGKRRIGPRPKKEMLE
jgi:hypothetical protein